MLFAALVLRVKCSLIVGDHKPSVTHLYRDHLWHSLRRDDYNL